MYSNHYTRQVLLGNQKHNLIKLYTKLYSISSSALEISSVYFKYSSVEINGKRVGSHGNRTQSSSIVMVSCNNQLFCTKLAITLKSRAARVDYFCKHVVTINGENHTVTLVSLSLFKIHPKSSEFDKPVTVYNCDIFEPEGIYSLIPVQFIEIRCVSLLDKLDRESVLFVCPCVDF